MELKRYLEIDSKTALEKIKSEHGEEALIISSDKVGNKTEVIVGVSKKEDAYETPIKEKGRSEAFQHALEANSNSEIEKSSSRNDGKNPWSVIEKLNSEIADIRSTMLEIKEQKEREKALRISEIDKKIESCGFNLAPIEEYTKWESVNIIMGKPGSGKTEIIKRLLDQICQEGGEALVIALGNINDDKSLLFYINQFNSIIKKLEDLENQKFNLKSQLKNFEEEFQNKMKITETKINKMNQEVKMLNKAIGIIKNLKNF